MRGRDYLAHITVCTSALSLIWHQIRPPVCESRQPLASWACNPTDPYPDWHGLFTLVTSTETFNAPLSLFFSLSLLLFPSPNTHYFFSIYLTTLCPHCLSLYVTILSHHMNSSLPHLSSCSHDIAILLISFKNHMV